MGRILDLFINKYNYTDFHELNLDWIISDLRTLAETLENFISLNTIKYANPIQWNITTQYETNTVVIDANDGTAYLSVKPVPSGVALTNTDYWTPIFTLNLLSANQNITLRDDGSNVLATFASDTDDWLIWNSILYKVSQPIAINEAYVPGYNLDRYSVEQFLTDAVTAINNNIGELSDLNTTDKSDLVSAINEVFNSVKKINDGLTPSIINVLNEGIANDGVTDIADDVETLINNAPLHAVIFFPPGLYYFGRGITISNSVTLLGCSDHYVQIPRNDKTTTTFLSNAIANSALITFAAGSYNHAVSHISFYSDSLSVVTNPEAPAGTARYHFEFPVRIANYSCIDDQCNTVGNKYDSLYIHGYSGTALKTVGGYTLIESCFIYTCGLGLYMQRDGQVSNTFIEFCDNGAEFRGGISVVNTRIEEIGKTAVKTVGSCKYSNVTIDQVGYAGIELIDWAFGINFSGKITRCGQYYFSLTYEQFLAIPDAQRIDSAYSLIYANNQGNKANLFILGEDNGYEAYDDVGTNKKTIFVIRGSSSAYVNGTIVIIPHTTRFADLPDTSGVITWITGEDYFKTIGTNDIDNDGGSIAGNNSKTFSIRGINATYLLIVKYGSNTCSYFVNTNSQGTAAIATPMSTEVNLMQVTTSGLDVTITNVGSSNGNYGYMKMTPIHLY